MDERAVKLNTRERALVSVHLACVSMFGLRVYLDGDQLGVLELAKFALLGDQFEIVGKVQPISHAYLNVA